MLRSSTRSTNVLFAQRLRTSITSLLVLFTLVAFGANPSFAQQSTGPFNHPKRDIRSRNIDQQHIRLNLKIDADKKRVEAQALHRLVLLSPQSSIVFDAVGLTIQKVSQTNDVGEHPQELKFRHEGGSLHIELGRVVPAQESLRILIDYVIDQPKGGIHFVHPEPHEPALKMVWTQGEPEFARYWIPCLDSSSDRLTSETITTVPKDWVVLSNGLLSSQVENADGTKTWHWQQAHSHVTYLISIAAGQFETFEQSWDGIPILSYVPKGRLADAPRSFEKTAAMLEFFTKKIGYRYPWPKYAQICVDEYNWGGMENTSATTLNLNTLHSERDHLDISSDNLVAHELAHQWWGDLVTCKDWGELWLNESFATYFATLWTEHDEGWDKAAIARMHEAKAYLGEDARYRRSIVNYRYDRPESMFDSHTYPKGGRVLHMLRNEVGEDAFWKSLRHYIEVHQFRTVETADLKIAFEETTGQGLGWFFDQWVHHGGHPDFAVSWTWDAEQKSAKVVVRQTQKVDALTPLFRVSADIAFALPGAEKESIVTKRVQISKAEETFHFPLDARPVRVCFDPSDWLLKTLSFPKSLEELSSQLQNDPSVICRLQAVEGLSPLEDPISKSLLLKAAKSDSEWNVRLAAVSALSKRNGDDVRDTLLAIVKEDVASKVRAEAATTLNKFTDDSVKQALRERLPIEPSYAAIANILRTLAKIAPDQAVALLAEQLPTQSHHETVLRAAVDGLVDLKAADAPILFQKHLENTSAERKAILLGGIARLQPKDQQAVAAKPLIDSLKSPRKSVRSVAIATLVALKDPQYIAPLQEARQQESIPAMMREMDDAIGKLQAAKDSRDSVSTELEELRKQNEELKKRLDTVETRLPPQP